MIPTNFSKEKKMAQGRLILIVNSHWIYCQCSVISVDWKYQSGTSNCCSSSYLIFHLLYKSTLVPCAPWNQIFQMSFILDRKVQQQKLNFTHCCNFQPHLTKSCLLGQIPNNQGNEISHRLQHTHTGVHMSTHTHACTRTHTHTHPHTHPHTLTFW